MNDFPTIKVTIKTDDKGKLIIDAEHPLCSTCKKAEKLKDPTFINCMNHQSVFRADFYCKWYGKKDKVEPQT